MTEQEVVVALMESSRTTTEWDANCDKIKEFYGGYPSFWFEVILRSGVAKRTLAKFDASDELSIG